jgi:hypothetical protein
VPVEAACLGVLLGGGKGTSSSPASLALSFVTKAPALAAASSFCWKLVSRPESFVFSAFSFS